MSRLDKDRTDGLLTESKKAPTPPQNVMGLGEDLQYWAEKVISGKSSSFTKCIIACDFKELT